MEKQEQGDPQISRMNTLKLSMNEQEVELCVVYVGDTELKIYDELAPLTKKLQSGTFPFCGRLDRVHKMTIDRTEENVSRIEKALEGYCVKHLTFHQASIKLMPDITRVLSGMKSEAVTIYQEQIEDDGLEGVAQCAQFANVVFSLKFTDDFPVQITFREYSEPATLLLLLLAERATTLKVEIQTHDNTDYKFIDAITSILPQLLSQSTGSSLISIDNQAAPLHTNLIAFQDLCNKLEESEAKRRLIFHVDDKPTEFENMGPVAFKVVPFERLEVTFVVHIDSTGTECDCVACSITEREESEAKQDEAP